MPPTPWPWAICHLRSRRYFQRLKNSNEDLPIPKSKPTASYKGKTTGPPPGEIEEAGDLWLVERKLAETREKAKALIMAGVVLAGTQRIDKPGDMLDIAQAATLVLKASATLPYVSRGGLKLAHALDEFKIDPVGKLGLDIGASTGGFTDCLLQRGAQHVWAVDVGHSQLDWKIRQDARVTVLDKTNIRYLENLPALPDNQNATLAQIVVIDVSFISLKLVLPAARRLSQPRERLLWRWSSRSSRPGASRSVKVVL